MVFVVMNWPLSTSKFCQLFFLFFSLETVHMHFKKKVVLLSDPISFSVSLLEAFDVLSKRLRSDEKKDKDIPLKVSSVHPLDPGTFS